MAPPTPSPDLPLRTKLRVAGVLGSLGMALGVAADLASGYATGATAAILTPFSVLSLENLSPFLLTKPYWQVVAGHYLAIVGIPLGLLGFWQVYRAIRPAGGWLPRLVWLLGAWGFVVGTVFHAAFAFVIAGLQADANAGPLDPMLARFATVFEPVGLALVGVMTLALVGLFYLVAFRETRYPRWFAALNPLVVQALTAGLALLAPEAIRVALIVTAYNLSVLVLVVGSTALLWNLDELPAATDA